MTLQNIQQYFLSALLVAAVDTAPLPWCHLGTLPLGSLPLSEPFASWQALKLISVSCQISNQFRFEVHQFSYPKSSLLCQFFDWPRHSLLSTSL